MTWYQPIECDNTVKNPLVCDFSNFEDYDFSEDDFKTGRAFDSWPDDVIFKASQLKFDGTPDDVLQNAYMIPIYSQRIKDKLEEENITGIQYLPVNVFGFNGNEYKNYHIANITNYYEAFDYKNAEYNTFADDFPNPHVRGKLAGVKKFVLIRNKISKCDIFRLVEYNQRFFITEKIQKLFYENAFSGYSFKKVSVSP